MEPKRKKRLLQPPEGNDEILLIPPAEEIAPLLKTKSVVGTAHQAYFFHPGIALKYLFLEQLRMARKEMLFVDTDATRLEVNLPPLSAKEPVVYLEFLNSDRALCAHPVPDDEFWQEKMGRIEAYLKKLSSEGYPGVGDNFARFKSILFSLLNAGSLPEILARAFLEYFNIKKDIYFYSALLRTEQFKEFFSKIYERRKEFRRIFNEVLTEYKQEFKFRYKNYPFRPLEDGELPFWLIKEGKRFPLFAEEVQGQRSKGKEILPRASTLTLFLRLHRYDTFIHGTGGGNYEWVQDRLIERFYGRTPDPYIVLSGTFFLGASGERDFPYFFYSPDRIRQFVPK